MAYRCIHCGAYTGETIEEVHASNERHGVGICVSPCQWCNEGVKHAERVCANGGRDKQGKLFQMVRDFNEYWGANDVRASEKVYVQFGTVGEAVQRINALGYATDEDEVDEDDDDE